MTLSIRARLTLWYTAVLSLVLVVSGATLYLTQSRSRMGRLDEELARGATLLARTVAREMEEGQDLPPAAHEALEDIDIPGRSLAVFDANGTLVLGRWEGLPRDAGAAAGGVVFRTVPTPAGAARVHRALCHQGETTFEVGVAEDLGAVARELAGLRDALLGSLLFGLVLAVGGGWWIARGALRPVELLALQAGRITGRTPGDRLTPPNPEDELGQLARAFNELLARLESALHQQRQFMADASHELRTPVSVARTAIEVTLSRIGRLEEEYRDSLGIVAAQMRRLTRLVEDMFTLARADASGLPLERAPLYLDELVADCVKGARVLAEPRGVRVDSTGPPDLELHGDEPRLRRMLMNLVENAVRHTPSGGLVRLAVEDLSSAVEVAISDSGPGIAQADRDRVFSRFVRLDPARAGEGAGLGLPIARAIAEAHGGTLILARSDASGSTFLVRLPFGARPA